MHRKSYIGWARELSDALAERYDYPNTHALSQEETRALVNTPTFVEGFLDDDAAHLHTDYRKSSLRGSWGIIGIPPSSLMPTGAT